MNLIKRVDLIFHLSLIVLLWHRPRWLFSDSIVFSWYHPLKSLSDLIVIALVKNIWYSRPIFHILSCVLPIFKMVGRLLNFYEVFEVDDFVAVCLVSCLICCIGLCIARGELRPVEPRVEPDLSYSRLFRFADGHWRRLLVGIGVLLVRLPFSLAVPHFVSEGIGALLVQDANRLKHACICLFACGCADAMLDFWCVYIFATSQQEIVFALRAKLFRAVSYHRLEFFDRTAIGELQSRLNADTAQIANDLSWVFRFAIEAVVRITGVACYMFWCSWRLAVLVLLMVPLNAAANTYFGQWMARNAKECQDLLASSNSVANETFGSIQTVKSFAAEGKALSSYLATLLQYKNLQYTSAIVSATYYMFVSTFLMNTLVQTGIVAYGGFLALNGLIETQRLVSFMLYRSQLQEYFGSLMNTYVNLVKCAGLSDRIFALLNEQELDEDDESENSQLSVVSPGTPPTIEFCKVSLWYKNRPDVHVLDKVSFFVSSGSCTALVGHSGSGKSSLVSLLLRLYVPQSGHILINGVDLGLVSLKNLRGRILAVVSQEPVLFRGTIRDNILYSLSGMANLPESVIDRLLINAAETACIRGFIEQLPDTWNSPIGDRGVTLSGGQKQRIAIARAIIANPPVLLLDEAMSALDAESEVSVQTALNSAMKSRTTIMVSHRMSSVVEVADHVVVLHKGRVVEEGAPAELLAKPKTLPGEVSLRTFHNLQIR